MYIHIHIHNQNNIYSNGKAQTRRVPMQGAIPAKYVNRQYNTHIRHISRI